MRTTRPREARRRRAAALAAATALTAPACAAATASATPQRDRLHVEGNRIADKAGNLSPATPAVTATTRPGTGGGPGCTATSRQGGFQAEVAVADTGTAAPRGWSVEPSVASRRTITSLWNGALTGSTVTDAAHDGSPAPSAAATFGIVANDQATGGVTAVSCTAN